MKIEYHSTVIEIIKGDGWRKAIEDQLPVLFKDDEDKISLLQFYSAFCDKDGNYLFNKISQAIMSCHTVICFY